MQVFGQPKNVAFRGFAYFDVNFLNTKNKSLKSKLLKPGFLLNVYFDKNRGSTVLCTVLVHLLPRLGPSSKLITCLPRRYSFGVQVMNYYVNEKYSAPIIFSVKDRFFFVSSVLRSK